VTTLEQTGKQLQKLTMQAIRDGVGPLTGSEAYAKERLARSGDREATIRRIVRESVLQAGTHGFVTSLGGPVALLVALPANIAGNLIINARMVGAIAYLRGYDLDDPHSQAVIMLTVAGSSAQTTATQLGMKVGQQAAKQAIQAVPIAVIRKINQRAGFYLVAKYGTKRSLITLLRWVPFIGAFFGGAVDATFTRVIGGTAEKVFPS
jgi:hypothetical protein